MTNGERDKLINGSWSEYKQHILIEIDRLSREFDAHVEWSNKQIAKDQLWQARVEAQLQSLAEMVPAVHGLVEQATVQEAINNAFSEANVRKWSKWEKAGLVIGVLFMLFSFILNFLFLVGLSQTSVL